MSIIERDLAVSPGEPGRQPAGLLDQEARGRFGERLHAFIAELYPLCRSITGDGVRETLRAIGQLLPLEIHEIPSGTNVFDWTVPSEWNIHDAYVKDADGVRVIDFQRSNLHVVSYSQPVRARMSLDQLKEHLFTLPDHADWIPYRTTYYRQGWGFCLSHRAYERLREGEYEVVIDASMTSGSLTYGECLLPGETEDEVLVSAHVCHPSLCNDNLSGVAVATFLGAHLLTFPRRYSYRFLFAPTTIGAIAWLAHNEHRVSRVRHGLVLSCVGDSNTITYKRSRQGNAEIDRAATHVLKSNGVEHKVVGFSPYGYDERQFCSPGFDLPVGCFMRTPNGQFPEYHTSADNLEFVKAEQLEDSFVNVLRIMQVVDRNETYVNLQPKGEPQLGKRGLYSAPGSGENLALLWVLNLSDGKHSLLDVAERSGLSFDTIDRAAQLLVRGGLLERQSAPVSAE